MNYCLRALILFKKQWQQLARQFLHRGLMVQDMEFGSLKLTAKGWDILKGDLKVLGELDQKNAALKAFDQCGSEYLKPAFDFLCGEVDYDELKILRLYHLIKKNGP